MKHILVASTLFFIFFLPVSFLFADSPQQRQSSPARHRSQPPEIVPNLVIIKFRAHTPSISESKTLGLPSVDAVLQRVGIERTEHFGRMPETSLKKAGYPDLNIHRMIKVYYSSDTDPNDLAQELSLDPAVEYAEPYYIFPLHIRPNDPRLEQQWAVDVMNLPDAWDVTTGDSNIVIGNVDTGIDWKHPDLALNMWINPGEWGDNGELSNNGIDDDGNGKVDDWIGWDFVGSGTGGSRKPDNDPMDGEMGHGTMTSGCSSARTDNHIGIAGSSFHSKILAIKASGDDSKGVAAGYEGITYAVQMGAKIVNCSWGSVGTLSQALQDVINDANTMGVLVVASAGNDPLDNDYMAHWPSSYTHVLNVGSVEPSGDPSSWCTYGTTVDVYAPGTNIWTTRKNAGYTNQTGTSLSTPLAAGVAVLVMSVHPDWTPDQVATQIRVTSDAFDTQRSSKYYGRINAYRAVTENQTLNDIPGIRLKDASVQYDGGSLRFVSAGQKATVSFTLENVLAPTSEAALATLDIDDPSIIAAAANFPIGNMNTFDTRSFEFEIRLSDNPFISEGYVPVRIRIEDGSYVDFVVVRAQVYIEDGWHSSFKYGTAYFNDIKALTATTAWAAARSGNNDYLFRTVTSGGNWTNAAGTGYPSGKRVYCVAPVSGQIALVGTGPANGDAEIYRTTNAGTSWAGVSVSAITGYVNWIHMFDESNGVFQGNPKNNTWGIASTTDGGKSWVPVATSVSSGQGEVGWSTSYASVGDTLWFGTNNNSVYKSTDRGKHWRHFVTPGKNTTALSFADNLRGAALHTPQKDQDGEYGLSITTNGGESWTELTSILLFSADGVEMEPKGKRMWLFQGPTVFVSTDMGGSWTVQAVPVEFSVSATAVFSNGSRTDVYAGYSDLYKYRSDFEPYISTSVQPSAGADDFRVDYLYPNPMFNTGSMLGFSLNTPGNVRVELYDNLGKLIATELDARLAAGSHSLRVATGVYAPGTYHVRIISDGKIYTRRLQILK